MNTTHKLQKILQELESIDHEIGDLANGCEFAKQRRLCLESQTLLQSIHTHLRKGFANLEETEIYTGILDRI